MEYSNVRTWHKKHTETFSAKERLADRLARFMGSWTFIALQSFVIICWVIINLFAYFRSWDPYPFILLNLVFSLQAAYTAPVIMMSQNRQNDRDRHQALDDYETNVRSELEIKELKRVLERIEQEKLDRILLAIRDLAEPKKRGIKH